MYQIICTCMYDVAHVKLQEAGELHNMFVIYADDIV